jgi:hypothetical protein
MRLWSLNPVYLDRIGLLAVWREGLLAKKVIEGKTRDYTNHPQLIRFNEYEDPLLAINSYLYYIFLESKVRSYNFDKTKLSGDRLKHIVTVTSGQIRFEFQHLLKKLKQRDKNKYDEIKDIPRGKIETNPIFIQIDGEIEYWERGK